ncbi:hypothetical protein ASE76_07865 [Xylophilus sp. Leaf220]|nr:hypothetical protein ASE76_07865 [Xylophilus sp. Leaf220]
MPTAPQFVLTNQRATYSLAASTPVYTSQNRVGSVASATLSVDFYIRNTNSLGTLAVAVDLPSGAGAATNRYNLAGTLSGNGASLSGALGITGAGCSGPSNPCLGGSAEGFFANAAGSKVGLTFTGNSTTTGSFGGALAFTETGPRGSIPAATVGSPAASYVTSFAYLTSVGAAAQRTTVPDGDRVFFQGAELIESRPRGSQPDIVKGGTVTAASAGAGGIGVPGSLDFIGWGSWESGNINGTAGLPVISNVHYIVATPTTDASMPIAGTASYNLVGGSAPVSTTQGTGTLNSGSLTADFTAGTVGTVLNLGFGGNSYTVGGTGQFRQPGSDAAIIVPGSGSNGAPIAAVINGVFSGPNAYRAGITYSVTGTPATTGIINGAAVFQKVP